MIDVSKIVGYESMSTEEKLKALENYEVDYSGYVKKDLFDKTSSEVAKYKKQLQERMSAEEQAKAQQESEFEAMKNELAALKKEKTVQEHVSQFLSLGYDKELAIKSANALLDGDMATVFSNIKVAQENLIKNERANVLKGTPKPDSVQTDGGLGVTKEQFENMGYMERLDLMNNNPEAYNELSK